MQASVVAHRKAGRCPRPFSSLPLLPASILSLVLSPLSLGSPACDPPVILPWFLWANWWPLLGGPCHWSTPPHLGHQIWHAFHNPGSMSCLSACPPRVAPNRRPLPLTPPAARPAGACTVLSAGVACTPSTPRLCLGQAPPVPLQAMSRAFMSQPAAGIQ